MDTVWGTIQMWVRCMRFIKKNKLKYRYATYSVVNQQKAENSLCHIADKLRTNSGRHSG